MERSSAGHGIVRADVRRPAPDRAGLRALGRDGDPADATELAENAAATGLPAGARESQAYAGPFPPSGTHDYEFTLYAVGAAADVPAKAPLDQILHAIDPHVLARAKLVASFTKP